MLLEVRRFHVAADISGIALDLSFQLHGVLDRSDHLTQLLLDHEGRFHVDVQLPAKFERCLAFGFVDPKRDSEKDVAMLQLASVKDRARGWRKLVRAFRTSVFPALAGDRTSPTIPDRAIDPINDLAATLRAEGLAIGLSVAEGYKDIDRFLRCSDFASNLMNKSDFAK